MITKRWICFLAILFVGEVFCNTQDIVYEEAQRSGDQCLSVSTVCASIFRFTKTVNGKRQKTERRVVNCLCPGSNQCPNLVSHNIYDTFKHKLGMCQPITDLKECRVNQVAQEVHLQDKNIGLFSYTNVKCLCPHHFQPLPGIFNRAVKYNSTRMQTNHLVHHYTCKIPI